MARKERATVHREIGSVFSHTHPSILNIPIDLNSMVRTHKTAYAAGITIFRVCKN